MDIYGVRRFFHYVEIHPSGCWLWKGATFEGYGIFKGRLPGDSRKVARRVHRWAYQMFVGFNSELSIDHLCRQPSCVNPLHLEAVTYSENFRRNLESLKARDQKGKFAVAQAALPLFD